MIPEHKLWLLEQVGVPPQVKPHQLFKVALIQETDIFWKKCNPILMILFDKPNVDFFFFGIARC